MAGEETRFAVASGIGRITLDRPKALNALTLDQIRAIYPTLRAWMGDDAVRVVVIGAAGERAFSAGGDIRSLYDARQSGDRAFLADFYREEYRLNHLIRTYPKPYVALIDGIVMGGGVGVSIHGSHRVATERTMFAMPETGIGLFPDVGGTYFLPRCPGRIGMYLALTGTRLDAADALYAGIATHFVPSARLVELEEGLRCADMQEGLHSAITCVIDSYHEEPGPSALAERAAAIDRCFGGASVEEIMAALGEEGGEWAEQTLEVLRAKSPTSLKVTFRQMQVGARLDFERAMLLEYRLSQRFMDGHDFFEGIRAVIIDKDQKPRWQPSSLAEVSADTVDAYFKPLDGIAELAFD